MNWTDTYNFIIKRAYETILAYCQSDVPMRADHFSTLIELANKFAPIILPTKPMLVVHHFDYFQSKLLLNDNILTKFVSDNIRVPYCEAFIRLMVGACYICNGHLDGDLYLLYRNFEELIQTSNPIIDCLNSSSWDKLVELCGDKQIIKQVFVYLESFASLDPNFVLPPDRYLTMLIRLSNCDIDIEDFTHLLRHRYIGMREWLRQIDVGLETKKGVVCLEYILDAESDDLESDKRVIFNLVGDGYRLETDYGKGELSNVELVKFYNKII